MSERPVPKFEVGQVVAMKSGKQLTFRIVGRIFVNGQWWYQWNKKNAANEHMIRALDAFEIGMLAPKSDSLKV